MLFDASRQAEHAASRLAALGASRATPYAGRSPQRSPQSRLAVQPTTKPRVRMDELLALLGSPFGFGFEDGDADGEVGGASRGISLLATPRM